LRGGLSRESLCFVSAISIDPIPLRLLAHDGLAYIPCFRLGGMAFLQSNILSRVVKHLDATPM
jgi:hypothetical protein